jgi:hypothetical protein
MTNHSNFSAGVEDAIVLFIAVLVIFEKLG